MDPSESCNLKVSTIKFIATFCHSELYITAHKGIKVKNILNSSDTSTVCIISTDLFWLLQCEYLLVLRGVQINMKVQTIRKVETEGTRRDYEGIFVKLFCSWRKNIDVFFYTRYPIAEISHEKVEKWSIISSKCYINESCTRFQEYMTKLVTILTDIQFVS